MGHLYHGKLLNNQRVTFESAESRGFAGCKRAPFLYSAVSRFPTDPLILVVATWWRTTHESWLLVGYFTPVIDMGFLERVNPLIIGVN